MRMLEHVVVVGGSLAGLRAAESLRTGGYGGELVVVGAERHRPYDRPPLSKKLLAGEWESDRIELRKPDDLDSLGVTWRLGVPATGLDVDGRRLMTGDGTEISFDGIVIATGSAPRRLPGQSDWPHVVELRTLDDALDLRARLVAGSARVVVIGAGFIGLEVAATARRLGNDVVVLEGAPAPLIRGLGAEMGAACAAVHADHGVVIRCGIAVESIDAGGVCLGDGEHVPADVIVVGIGVAPVTDWLTGSGLEIRDGIVCDSTLNVGAPLVYAAGDVVRWPNQLFGEEMRVEHWTNAAEQGALAATNMLAESRGEPGEAYAPVPFFWSDQYDRRIQFLGCARPGDDVLVVSGSVEERSFLALYGHADRLRGVLGMNLPRLVMKFRPLLAQGATFDEGVSLAAVLNRA
jgi:NADPH-dependent 2,4-dienoyl-CoA reductase/sulfur reductase-like enzyme